MQTIKMDFQSQSTPPVVPVMQSDSQSRFIGLTLYDGGVPYSAPSGAVYTVEYHGQGANNIGWYDTIQLSSGTRKAVVVSSSSPNVVTLELAEQALRVNGEVKISLCVVNNTGYKLNTFPIICRVTGAPYVDPVSVRSYFYVTGLTSEQWMAYVTACQDAQKRAEDAAAKFVIDPTLSVSGKAADAAKVGEAVGRLKEDLGDLSNTIFADESVKIVGLGNIPGSQKKNKASVAVGDSYIQLVYNNNYISYEFYVTRNGTLYFGNDVLSLSYCAIAKGNKPTGDWYNYSETTQRLNVSSSVRYRTSEDNLPTEENKLNVLNGDVIIITVPNNAGTLTIYGSSFNNALQDNIALSATQRNQVKSIIESPEPYTITKVSDTMYDISFGDYTTHLSKDETPEFEHWNLRGIKCLNIELVTTSTDILGPIREQNNLYIGGVHGKEKTTNLTIIADGAILNMSVGDIVRCNILDVIHESNITSTVTNEVTWNRFYHLTFKDMKIIVENNYTCVKETTIKRATNGGIFGSPNTVTNAISVTNKLYKPAPTSEKTETTYLNNAIEATWYYSNGHSITISNLVGKDENGYKCIMTIYGEEIPIRTKIYFLPVDASTNYNNGDVLYGKFQLEFN